MPGLESKVVRTVGVIDTVGGGSGVVGFTVTVVVGSGWTLVVVTETEAKETVELPALVLAEPPLSAGAPPVRLVHPVCWNIQLCGSAVPAAHTLPSKVPLFSASWNQYQVPTFQLKV